MADLSPGIMDNPRFRNLNYEASRMKVFGDVLMRVWMVLGVLGQLASAAVGLIYWERDSFATGLQYWLICGLLIAGVTILGGGAILFVFGLRDDDGRPFWGRSTK